MASASGQKNTRQKRVDNKKPAGAGVYKTHKVGLVVFVFAHRNSQYRFALYSVTADCQAQLIYLFDAPHCYASTI
jgi:hypothetical protein